ncbi:MtrAB system accessory lipoprotein LpqB [Nocardia abscessus]|uniref:MtrAB system accessory lipoprotein LpqB n=1 Tax=Nocardia abscessus TaxID=120957 RepID=UPI0002F16133|nr:MtrAB system accessory lipoprotein LpqB [Nocardia abscessus]MCC3329253.1 MtrAB system accessory lipoprotein LpqB [Nocardia abscessus]
MTMRVRTARTQRLTVLAAAVLAVLVPLTACASLPESSAPEALGTINRGPTPEGPPPPVANRDPDLLLRDFLQATADPADRHLAARQYMTPAASTQWDDAAGTVIVEKPDTLRESRSGDKATYQIRARKVGELAADGGYRPSDDLVMVENKIELTKVDGEWRIDELPDGVVMDSTAFFKSYRRYVLYFIDPGGNAAVPDLRWMSVQKPELPQRLLSSLIEGPQPALASMLRNELTPPIALRGTITKINGDPDDVGIGLGGVRIDFAGASGLNPRDRELLAAQVVLTLSSADILGPYQLLADGKPLDERFAANGYNVADVQQFSPATSARNQVGLHALRGGGLVEVGDNGGITPAPGYFGRVTNLQTATLSPDGQFVAAVAEAGRPPGMPSRTLMVGTYGGNAFPVAEGFTITRPSWTADGSAAWAVVDGDRVVRAVNDRGTGNVSVQNVDISALTAASSASAPRLPITELRISRTGVRAAMIADGKVYVAVVVPQPDGKLSLASALPVGVGLSTAAVSVDWLDADSIIIAREGNIDPVSTVSVDGSEPTPLTSQNLTAPVRSVSASTDHQYVADSRAVLELTSAPDQGQPYWREVPGLGANAIPVLPG